MRATEESQIPSLLTMYGRINWQAALLGSVVVAAFFFCYSKVFATLVTRWWTDNVYSYAFLIPGISLYLIWISRDRLANLRPDPNYVGGLSVLFGGLLMLLLGHAGAVASIQELSLIPTIAGVVLLLLGTAFFRVLWFPIAYLLFMIPVWELNTDLIHMPFQLFTAALSVKMLHWVGIPVYRQGNYLELPNMTLEVAQGCSGVNYLFSVVAISIPLAYIFLRGWKKRATLVCFAVLVSILANSLRVFLIGVLVYNDLSGDIHGPYHILQGLSISVVGYGAIFLGLSVLTRIPSASLPLEPLSQFKGISEDAPLFSPKKSIRFAVIAAFALLLLAGSNLHFFSQSKPVSLTSDLQGLPLTIGAWQGERAMLVGNPYAELHVDKDLSRIYYRGINDVERAVQVYIGYFETQEQNKELIYFKALDYFNGATKTTVRLSTGKSIEVNRVIVEEGKERRLYLVWYDLNGRVVTDPYLAKLYTTWSGFVRRQTNGAVVLVSAEMNDESAQDEALSELKEFVRQIYPLLPSYLPGQ